MLDKIQRGWREPGWLNYVLLPLTWFYCLVISVRRILYRLNILGSTALPVPVVVVGGISAGGSGKTPVVLELARYLGEKGYRPGILARGYGGKSDHWPRQVDRSTNASLVGDEPQMLYELTGLPVVAGPDRLADCQYLISKCDCDVLISDDGFQHFALKRDVDIVVIDGQYGAAGFGNGWCLPAGPLREPPENITRAHLVLINTLEHTSGHLATATDSGMADLRFSFNMVLENARELDGENTRSIDSFAEDQIYAVAGTGNPERFFLQLEELGLSIVRRPFPDHHVFREADFEGLNDKAILMTEKDGVKCRQLSNIGNCWVVPGRARIASEFYVEIDRLLKHEH